MRSTSIAAPAPTPVAPAPRPTPSRPVGLHGRLIDAPGGTPVLVFPAEGGKLLGWAPTDEDGHFTIEVPAGRYQLRATSAKSVATATADYSGTIGSPDVDLKWSNACVQVEVALGGDAKQTGARFLVEAANLEAIDRWAVPASASEPTLSCLPAGSYRLRLVDKTFIIAPRSILLEQPRRLRIDPYLMSELQKAPPPDAKLPTMDRRSLLAGLTGADVIALGESNHGTTEYTTERLAMIEHLNSTGWLHAIAIEAGAGTTMALDDYVMGKNIDIRSAVARLGYWIWDVEEFVSFLKRVRKMNAKRKPGKRVHIVGVDVQEVREVAQLLLSSKVSTNNARLTDRLTSFVNDGEASISGLSKESIEQTISDLETIRREPWPASLAAAAVIGRLRMETASVHLAKMAERDKGIAELIAIAAERFGGGLVTIAHSGHMGKSPPAGLDTTAAMELMKHGISINAVAFLSASGQARAWDTASSVGVDSQEMDAAWPFSVEGALVTASNDAKPVYASMQNLPPALQEWIAKPRLLREFGAIYPGKKNAFVLRDVANAFDAIVLFDKSTATTPTKTGVRRAKQPPLPQPN